MMAEKQRKNVATMSMDAPSVTANHKAPPLLSSLSSAAAATNCNKNAPNSSNNCIKLIEIIRSKYGYGFTLSGEMPCKLTHVKGHARSGGLRSGDRLHAVNGQNVDTLSHDQVVELITSVPGGRLLLRVSGGNLNGHTSTSTSGDDDDDDGDTSFSNSSSDARPNMEPIMDIHLESIQTSHAHHHQHHRHQCSEDVTTEDDDDDSQSDHCLSTSSISPPLPPLVPPPLPAQPSSSSQPQTMKQSTARSHHRKHNHHHHQRSRYRNRLSPSSSSTLVMAQQNCRMISSSRDGNNRLTRSSRNNNHHLNSNVLSPSQTYELQNSNGHSNKKSKTIVSKRNQYCSQSNALAVKKHTHQNLLMYNSDIELNNGTNNNNNNDNKSGVAEHFDGLWKRATGMGRPTTSARPKEMSHMNHPPYKSVENLAITFADKTLSKNQRLLSAPSTSFPFSQDGNNGNDQPEPEELMLHKFYRNRLKQQQQQQQHQEQQKMIKNLLKVQADVHPVQPSEDQTRLIAMLANNQQSHNQTADDWNPRKVSTSTSNTSTKSKLNKRKNKNTNSTTSGISSISPSSNYSSSSSSSSSSSASITDPICSNLPKVPDFESSITIQKPLQLPLQPQDHHSQAIFRSVVHCTRIARFRPEEDQSSIQSMLWPNHLDEQEQDSVGQTSFPLLIAIYPCELYLCGLPINCRVKAEQIVQCQLLPSSRDCAHQRRSAHQKEEDRSHQRKSHFSLMIRDNRDCDPNRTPSTPTWIRCFIMKVDHHQSESHSNHQNISKMLNICCTPDPITVDHCLEFPETCEPILRIIYTLYRRHLNTDAERSQLLSKCPAPMMMTMTATMNGPECHRYLVKNVPEQADTVSQKKESSAISNSNINNTNTDVPTNQTLPMSGSYKQQQQQQHQNPIQNQDDVISLSCATTTSCDSFSTFQQNQKQQNADERPKATSMRQTELCQNPIRAMLPLPILPQPLQQPPSSVIIPDPQQQQQNHYRSSILATDDPPTKSLSFASTPTPPSLSLFASSSDSSTLSVHSALFNRFTVATGASVCLAGQHPMNVGAVAATAKQNDSNHLIKEQNSGTSAVASQVVTPHINHFYSSKNRIDPPKKLPPNGETPPECFDQVSAISPPKPAPRAKQTTTPLQSFFSNNIQTPQQQSSYYPNVNDVRQAAERYLYFQQQQQQQQQAKTRQNHLNQLDHRKSSSEKPPPTTAPKTAAESLLISNKMISDYRSNKEQDDNADELMIEKKMSILNLDQNHGQKNNRTETVDVDSSAKMIAEGSTSKQRASYSTQTTESDCIMGIPQAYQEDFGKLTLLKQQQKQQQQHEGQTKNATTRLVTTIGGPDKHDDHNNTKNNNSNINEIKAKSFSVATKANQENNVQKHSQPQRQDIHICHLKSQQEDGLQQQQQQQQPDHSQHQDQIANVNEMIGTITTVPMPLSRPDNNQKVQEQQQQQPQQQQQLNRQQQEMLDCLEYCWMESPLAVYPNIRGHQHEQNQPISTNNKRFSESESAKSSLDVMQDVEQHDERPIDVGWVGGWSSDFDILLNDPIGIKAFTDFLRKEFSFENLQFFLAVQDFKNLTNTDEIRQKSLEIYDKFISLHAPDPVNVDSKARKSVENGLQDPDNRIFLLAEKQIYNLMKFDSYIRFLKSDIYEKCSLLDLKGKPLPYEQDDFGGTFGSASCDNVNDSGDGDHFDNQNNNENGLRKHSSLDSRNNSIVTGTSKGAGNVGGKKRKSFLPWARLKSSINNKAASLSSMPPSSKESIGSKKQYMMRKIQNSITKIRSKSLDEHLTNHVKPSPTNTTTPSSVHGSGPPSHSSSIDKANIIIGSSAANKCANLRSSRSSLVPNSMDSFDSCEHNNVFAPSPDLKCDPEGCGGVVGSSSAGQSPPPTLGVIGSSGSDPTSPSKTGVVGQQSQHIRFPSSSFNHNCNRDNCHFLRIVFPDRSQTVVPSSPNETIENLIQRLVEKRSLRYLAWDVFITGNDKPLDPSTNTNSLGCTELRVEQRVLFQIEFPSQDIIGVKARPIKLCSEVFRPLLLRYGYRPEHCVMTVAPDQDDGGLGGQTSSAEPILVPSMSPVSVLDGQRIVVSYRDDLEEWGWDTTRNKIPVALSMAGKSFSEDNGAFGKHVVNRPSPLVPLAPSLTSEQKQCSASVPTMATYHNIGSIRNQISSAQTPDMDTTTGSSTPGDDTQSDQFFRELLKSAHTVPSPPSIGNGGPSTSTYSAAYGIIVPGNIDQTIESGLQSGSQVTNRPVHRSSTGGGGGVSHRPQPLRELQNHRHFKSYQPSPLSYEPTPTTMVAKKLPNLSSEASWEPSGPNKTRIRSADDNDLDLQSQQHDQSHHQSSPGVMDPSIDRLVPPEKPPLRRLKSDPPPPPLPPKSHLQHHPQNQGPSAISPTKATATVAPISAATVSETNYQCPPRPPPRASLQNKCSPSIRSKTIDQSNDDQGYV